MRRTLYFAGFIGFILIIGLTVFGCAKGGGSPSSVSKQFYTALEKGDTKAVNELMTPESAEMMAMFMEKAKGTIASKGGVTKTEETINGDTAVVKTTFKDGSTEELNLVKVDGKWKIIMKK
jgi:hypothetical protein